MKNKHFKMHYLVAIIFIFLFFLHLMQATQSIAGETNIYFISEYFEWLELVNNDRSLKETGPRFGIGLNYDIKLNNQYLILKPRIEIIGGQVDYEGSTQSDVPVKSDTDYYDGKVELDLGWRIGLLKKSSIEPFAGTGLRGWYRNIHDSIASDGITYVIGYPEEWYSVYFRAGLRGNIALTEGTNLFVETGGKFPVYNENKALFDESDLGPNVTFKPGKQPSLFAEAGVQYKLFKASIYYDSMRFSKSDTEYSRGTGYYQPKTQADIYGIRLGMTF